MWTSRDDEDEYGLCSDAGGALSDALSQRSGSEPDTDAPQPHHAAGRPSCSVAVPAVDATAEHLPPIGAAVCLTIAGLFVEVLDCILSVVNAGVAGVLEAEKSHHLQDYVNTHWLTSVFLFAGIAALLRRRSPTSGPTLVLAVTLCAASAPVAIGSAVVDAVNIGVVKAHWASSSSNANPLRRWALPSTRLVGMLVYASCDLVLCLTAGFASIRIVTRLRHCVMPNRTGGDRLPAHPLLAALGAAIAIISVVKMSLWADELKWLKGLGEQARFMFMHYTLDEPVWHCVYLIAGAMTTLASCTNARRAAMYAALTLVAASLYPCFLYFWLDYRWYFNEKLSEITVGMPRHDGVLVANLVFAVVHGVISLATIALLARRISRTGGGMATSSGKPWRPLLASDTVHALLAGAVLFAAAAAVLSFSDLINLRNKSFYRVFHATEQKLPIQLFMASVLTWALARCDRHAASIYVLPALVVVLLCVAHTTVFHVTAYVYLASNQYFAEHLCALFFIGSERCTVGVERAGALAHFLEALMSLCVFALCAYILCIALRLMRLHQAPLGAMTFQQIRQKSTGEKGLMVLAWVQIGAGLLLLVLSATGVSTTVGGPTHDGAQHPLLVVHSVIYRSCLTLALIIFPILQHCLARHVLYHPLRLYTLLAAAGYRFVEVLTQLDYRNIGQSTGLAWQLFSQCEVLSMCFSFASICLCISLHDLAVECAKRTELREMNGSADERGRAHANGNSTANLERCDPGDGLRMQPADPTNDKL